MGIYMWLWLKNVSTSVCLLSSVFRFDWIMTQGRLKYLNRISWATDAATAVGHVGVWVKPQWLTSHCYWTESGVHLSLSAHVSHLYLRAPLSSAGSASLQRGTSNWISVSTLIVTFRPLSHLRPAENLQDDWGQTVQVASEVNRGHSRSYKCVAMQPKRPFCEGIISRPSVFCADREELLLFTASTVPTAEAECLIWTSEAVTHHPLLAKALHFGTETSERGGGELRSVPLWSRRGVKGQCRTVAGE